MEGIAVKNILKKNGFLLKSVADSMGETPQNLNSMLNAQDIKTGVVERIAEAIKKPLYFFFPEHVELESDSAPNHEQNPATTPEKEGKIIPFYDDVSSIGGYNSTIAKVDGISQPTEYIDTGDWFREATAAIRHYGESMVEYPEGCILALKEVNERQLIVWGRDYVIETSEYRVTKRIQRGNDIDHITAYSTNKEVYADGRLVHEPLDIPWSEIRHISLILGYVVKKNGGTMVFNKK